MYRTYKYSDPFAIFVMLYNFYIFNRKGKCLFYKEWDRPVNKMADDPDEERKLVFGMLFSLKDLTSKLSPDPQGNDHLHIVKTNGFTLHHYQSPTGLMFVLNTRADVPGT
jgi:trafficking protein particle complex subunit 1